MSVILSYADAKRAIIASDGLVVDKSFNHVNENFSKVRRINDRVIIGFGGDAIACSRIVDLMTSQSNAIILNQLYFEDTVSVLKLFLKNCPPTAYIGFLVCGIGKNGKMYSGGIDSRSSEHLQCITGSYTESGGIYPEETPQGDDILRYHLSIFPQDPLSAIKRTVSEVSRRSRSVNDTMFVEEICTH